ncbi:MAG: transglycosylase domain-containing protein, partial [Proteobacteria bacterium]|nr:transglycosylase domain-containing protein [Pseudomonadota bacterium]
MGHHRKKNGLLWKLLKLVILIHVIILSVGGVLILAYKFVNPPTTSLALYRDYFKHVKNKPFKFVSLKNIPYTARADLVRLEDPNFRNHHGLDLRAIWEAYKINRRYGKKIAGGSTITQQITRTLFLTPHKNYIRKYIEVMLALEMEVLLSKDRILELYFNYVEFGKGIYGIGPGAYYHYHKDLSKLSTGEIARLIIILPSPVKYGVNDISKK